MCIAEPLGYHTTADMQQQQQQQQKQKQHALTEPAAAAGITCNGAEHQQQQQQGALSASQLGGMQLGSWCWWCLRAVMLQQHVLSGRSITLHTALKALMQDTLVWARELPPAAATNGSTAATDADVQGQVLCALAHLEVALVQQSIGVVADAEQHLEAAAAALGVEVELTGALGMRTRHQIDPKAQLVAAVKAAGSSSSGVAAAAGLEGLDVAALGFEEVGLTKELEGMEDDSAVYLAPRLVDQAGTAAAAAGASSDAAADAAAQPGAAADGVSSNTSQPAAAVQDAQQQQQQQGLSPLLQALLLGWASQIKKGTSQDELQQWQMAPFVEAVLQQQHTQYMLHATARLLKCR
jgi:hypothetical protein